MENLDKVCEKGVFYELIDGLDFPIMQSKIPHFHVFRVNRGNFSDYLKLFLWKFLYKRNCFVYLSDRVVNLIPQPINGAANDRSF